MKLVVGLGNPGKKYARTRHNVGWVVLDRMVKQVKSDPFGKAQGHPEQSRMDEKLKVKSYSPKFKVDKRLKSEICEVAIGGKRVVLAKPLTFMNNSGEAIKTLNTKYKILNTNLYVVHDDLDISLGSFKIQFGKGPKEHKGVESVEKALGTKDFWRVRVGVENRKVSKTTREEGEDYVLGKFTGEELKILEKVIPGVAERLLGEVKGWGNLDRAGGRV